RGPDRHFAFSNSRAHQQQVGDVGAGDQQYARDGSEKHREQRLGAANVDVLQPVDAEAFVLVQRLREFRSKAGGRSGEARLGLGEGDAGLDPSRGGEVVALIDAVRVELERQPDVRRVAKVRRVEARRRDADDDIRIAAQRDRLADDVAVRCEAAGPPSVRQYGNV